MQPILLGELVKYVAADNNDAIDTWNKYFYAAGIAAVSLVYAITHQPFIFICQLIPMQIRVATGSLVYKKVWR